MRDCPAEAEIIRRIHQEFAVGYAPKKIAQRLNADGIAGPRGTYWRDSAIRGHRQRGTGIINNELYIERLIWNRLRYLKNPETGKRVSRLNPEQDWVIHDVPELGIVTDALWDAVKQRQEETDATPAVQGIRKSRFWEKKRSRHLLTGKLACGCCGGGFAAVGKDYLACSNARKLQTCAATRSIKRATLEDAALGLLRDRLMQPDAVAEFVTAFPRAANAPRREEGIKHDQTRKALQDVERKLAGLYDAIAEGLRTPGLLQKLQALKDEAVRAPALDLLRSLIDRVVVHHDAGTKGITLQVERTLSAMIAQAQPGGLGDVDPSSLELVAGARIALWRKRPFSRRLFGRAGKCDPDVRSEYLAPRRIPSTIAFCHGKRFNALHRVPLRGLSFDICLRSHSLSAARPFLFRDPDMMTSR
ncbi:recombinase family protein [Salipiger bermudensis]|uniref:recombinase family protein n=1 Tax=Salipiger bermudensis TaxID=344736 RepID=UPI001CD7F117|nr:recombinase family protein [Salipiger bermudensis]MCA1288678.1 recombinase family protein [Salipiger bermudensis]